MAQTVQEILLDVLEQSIASVKIDPDKKWLYRDLKNKLIMANVDEIELNFKRNLDLLKVALLVAGQLGAPPQSEEIVDIPPPPNPEEIL